MGAEQAVEKCVIANFHCDFRGWMGVWQVVKGLGEVVCSPLVLALPSAAA